VTKTECASLPICTRSCKISIGSWRRWVPVRLLSMNWYRMKSHQPRGCNPSKKGLDGVCFVSLTNGQLLPLLWWHEWPALVASKLVSTTNHGGTITDSDLELAANIAQFDVLAQTFDVHSTMVHNLSDNAAAVAWQKKGCLNLGLCLVSPLTPRPSPTLHPSARLHSGRGQYSI
jgi:hypothetical protein